jgi:hypothetical protein
MRERGGGNQAYSARPLVVRSGRLRRSGRGARPSPVAMEDTLKLLNEETQVVGAVEGPV